MKNLTDRIQENNLSTVLGIVITEIIEYYFLSKDYFLNKYGVNQDDLEGLQKHLFFQMRAAKNLSTQGTKDMRDQWYKMQGLAG